MNARARRHAHFCRATPYTLFAAVLAVTAMGQAQDDSDDADTAAVRRLAVEGLKLAESGHCSEAIDKLARAETLRHSPIVLELLGECQVEVGKIVEGSESLRRVTREEVPENPSPALSKALNRAHLALAAAKPKIAWLTISVAPELAEAQVSLDGKPISSAFRGDERPADPGEHLIVASAPGFLRASASVSLGAGEKRALGLTLEPDPSANAAPAPPARRAPARFTARKRQEPVVQTAPLSTGEVLSTTPDRTAAYVTWVVSGVSAAAGATFGILAWHDKSDLEKQCDGVACPPASWSRLDQARRFGNLATGAFSVSGATLVLGTIFFATASSSSISSSTRGEALSGAPPGSTFNVHGFVGFKQVGVCGNF